MSLVIPVGAGANPAPFHFRKQHLGWARRMLDHADDLLNRYRRRRQIDQDQYQAGRRWQVLSQAAEGDEKATALRDGFFLDVAYDRKNSSRHALLRDVLGARGSLAGAAAARGMNPTTSSRDMKKLGAELRDTLRVLAKIFERIDRPAEDRTALARSFNVPAWRDSSPEIVRVRQLAMKIGCDIVYSGGAKFDVQTILGDKTNCNNRPLSEIEALLKRTLKSQPVRRKRGARGAAPVTLARNT